MPKYYCDYCDTHLTHDSPSVRKTHCAGRKHRDNVRIYYQKWMEEQAQTLIDVTTAAYKSRNMLTVPNAFMGQQNVPTMPTVPTGFAFNLAQTNAGALSNLPTATVGDILPMTMPLATCYAPPTTTLGNVLNVTGPVPPPPVATNSVASVVTVPIMVPPPPPQQQQQQATAATAAQVFVKNPSYNFPNISFGNGQQI